MILTSIDLGLGACHIEGAILKLRDNYELLETLKFPDGFTPVLGCVFGETNVELSIRTLHEERILKTFI